MEQEHDPDIHQSEPGWRVGLGPCRRAVWEGVRAYAPKQVQLNGVVGLPPGYQSASLQISWYVTSPASKSTSRVYYRVRCEDGAAGAGGPALLCAAGRKG